MRAYPVAKEYKEYLADSDEESSADDVDLEETFGVMKITNLSEEKLTDSDREVISSMKELRNHSWKPVDSLVVSIGKRSSRVSAMKGSRSSRVKKQAKREVSFQTVVVREYTMILGDNPTCSYGPPVCLDWEYEETKKLNLEEYEKQRANKRRSMRQMVLSYYKRCDILEAAGYTSAEMKQCTRRMNKLKRSREATKFFIPIQGVEAVVRSAGRKVKRAASGAKKE